MAIPDADLLIRVMIVAVEMVLLAFLYFISRFYEIKFGKRTYFNAYAIAVAVPVLAIVPAVLAPGSLMLIVTLIDALMLLVLAGFGLRLHRMMMGVSK